MACRSPEAPVSLSKAFLASAGWHSGAARETTGASCDSFSMVPAGRAGNQVPLHRKAGKGLQGGWPSIKLPDHWWGASLACAYSASLSFSPRFRILRSYLFPAVVTSIFVFQPTKINVLAIYWQRSCQCCFPWYKHGIVSHNKVLVMLFPDW